MESGNHGMESRIPLHGGGGGGEIYLPSHGGHGLHTSVSRGGPSLEQSFPPLAGRGLLQNLPRTLNPVLHVLLHSLQADHELYPPSTKEGRHYGKENRNLLLINFDCEVLKHQIPPVASILNHTKESASVATRFCTMVLLMPSTITYFAHKK